MVEMVRASSSRKAPNWICAVSVAGILAGCVPSTAMPTREGVRQYAPSTAPLMGRPAEARGSSMGETARSSQLAAILPSEPTAASTLNGEAPPIDNSAPRTNSYFRLDALRVEFLSDWAILHVSASVGPVEGTRENATEADATIALWPPHAIPTALRVKGDDGNWSGAKRLGALAADKWFGKARVDRQFERGQVFELGTEISAQELRIRPFAARELIHIEYDALMPTSFEQGMHQLGLPVPEGAKTISPQFDFPHGGKLVAASIESRGVASTSPYFEWTWRSPTTGVEAELVKTANGTNSQLAWRVRASDPLLVRPKNASLVIVLDQSRSVRKSQFLAFLQSAALWTAAYENAHVEILSFDRKVWRHTTQFVDRDAAAALLSVFPPVSRNGSNVEIALIEAVSLLKTRPQNRTILLLTDAEYSRELPQPKLRKLLREGGTQLFVGVNSHNDFRSQFEPLQRLSKDTNGTAMAIGAPKDIVELAVPSRVTHGQLRPQPRDCAGPIPFDLLAAGSALRAQEQIDQSLLLTDNRTANWGTLAFELGGIQQTRTIKVDKLLSRLEQDWQRGLEGNTAYVVAVRGNVSALSPPIAPRAARSSGASSYCGTGLSGSGAGGGGCRSLQLRRGLRGFFDSEWQRISRQCGVIGIATATVAVHATEIEEVNRVSTPKSPATVVECLEEGLWAVEGPEPESDDFCFSGEVELTNAQ